MRYRFIRMPRPCPLAAYNSAAEKIATYASRFPEVKAVYRMGNVTAPGISDLDMIVVLRDGSSIPAFDFLNILNPHEQYTLMHGVFLAPELFWKNRQLFFRYENLTLIAGEDILPLPISDQWKEWARLRLALQHILRVYLSLFVQLTSRVLRVRSLLCELHALRFDYLALQGILGENAVERLKNRLLEVGALRNDWFLDTDASKKRLVNIGKTGKGILKEVIERVGFHLQLRAFTSDGTSALDRVRGVQISGRRSISPDGDSLVEHRTFPARLAAVFAQIPLTETILARMTNTLGKYEISIPRSIYDFVTDQGGKRQDEQEFIDTKAKILPSGAVLQILKNGFAIPTLDFLEL